VAVLAQDAAQDPGVRRGPADVGGPRAALSPVYQTEYLAAKTLFAREIDGVTGSKEANIGLGPRFNANSCFSCHAHPTVGGSSPAQNPQIAIATLMGANNIVPDFITPNGPVREVRFKSNPDGTPDGGVHDLFTIAGRLDAVGCNIQQPDFAAAVAAGNAIFRIPTPVFGLGLVEEISDATIVNNAANPAKAALGIAGHPNFSGNDGTITRFGWKAQNKSLLVFAGEAYNVEIGVTNELFPQKRDETPGCQFNPLTEDSTNMTSSNPFPPAGYNSDITQFAMFMRLSAPPKPAPATPVTNAGAILFSQIGCNLCHTPTLTTGWSALTGQKNVPVNAFSDFIVHHMGTSLADGITQGSAGPDEFRTAPLWGLGQRIFFLHDGRTSDLRQAIMSHASSGSEANAVVSNFTQLSERDKQALLVFLRSL